MSLFRRSAVSFSMLVALSPSSSRAQGGEITHPSFAEGLFRVARVIDGEEVRDVSAGEIRYVRLLPQGKGRLEVVSVSDGRTGLRSSIQRDDERRMWYVEPVEGSGVPNVCLALVAQEPFECGRLRLNAPNRDLWLYAASDELARPSIMLIRMPARAP